MSDQHEHLLLNSDADAVARDVDRLIADGDDRTLLDRVSELPEVVRDLRASPDVDRFDVGLAVANAGMAGAVALRRGKHGVVDAALGGILAAYRQGDVHSDYANDADVSLYEAAAGALWALGAVAVTTANWAAVRSIVSREPEEDGYYASWLRHGQVMSARRATDPEDDNVLDIAARQLRIRSGFGMSDGADEERLRALCSFDQLALLVVSSAAPDSGPRDFYPSYAKYPAEYIEAGVVDLRRAGDMRSEIFPLPNDDLRRVLREANEMALFQAAQSRYAGRGWQYEGFQDARTWAFIREGHMLEDWMGGGGWVQ